MLTIIWAVGSMLVLLLIISFIPLGFTLKGKLFVVLTGFVLAMGGLAAVASFPLWQTLLILLVLAFFAAYMIDSRMGKVVYQEQLSLELETSKDFESPVSNNQLEGNLELDLVDLSEKERIAAPPLVKLRDSSQGGADLSSALPELSIEKDSVIAMEDEDISFLQDRDIVSEVDQVKEDSDPEVGYLSEIESLLLEESEQKIESADEGWLDELADIEPIEIEEKSESKEYHLDESELELLLATKEVAAGLENNLEETNSKKEVELLKK